MFNLINFTQNYSWAIQIGLAVLLGIVITVVEYFLSRKYLPRVKAKKQRWREIIISSLQGPFIFYIWVIVFTIVVEIVAIQMGFGGHFVNLLSPARRFLTLIFLFWFVMRFIRAWENSLIAAVNDGGQKTFQDATSVNAIAQLFRVIAMIVILLMILSTAGIKISTLLAFGGIGGLAISFAAKDTLANFIGGLMIYWDRPFSVGDWVSSPDRNIEGTVINIGWRLTAICTFDKRPLYVPNAAFSTISVENPSRMLNRRIRTVVGIRYADAKKVSVIVDGITKMLREHPEIDITQTLFVKLIEFGPSSLNILIYAFTKTTEWVKFQSVQEDVFLKIIDIVAENGAQFAFPTSTIEIPAGVETFNKINEDVNEPRSLR